MKNLVASAWALEFQGNGAGGRISRWHTGKMNAAAEVLSFKHWPPRGVYTRWRPRKRFCSGIVCVPPTSERKLSALRFAVCSILDIARLFLVILQNATPPLRSRKPIHTNQFQNGTLAQRCARVHRMAVQSHDVLYRVRFAVTRAECDNGPLPSPGARHSTHLRRDYFLVS